MRTPLPTDAELTILRVLWTHGASTVRDVHDALGGGTGYTTTLKLLQNMYAKGLVRRDDAARQHVYRARVAEAPTLGALAAQLADRFFGGSAGALALRALGARAASPAELRELKRLIRDIEQREGPA
jgi:predicted transcriptional regulator